MQSMNDLLTCSDCQITYKTATALLKHFAQHVREMLEKPVKKSTVPGLYPIKEFKALYNKRETMETEENGDSGFEDVNPMILCEATLNEDICPTNCPKTNRTRKYQCKVCAKLFGWSTDLKRHELKHTGEKPFACAHCSVTYTRKFLLQRHQIKKHLKFKGRHDLPELKPIGSLKHTRKQDKCKIKHNQSM